MNQQVIEAAEAAHGRIRIWTDNKGNLRSDATPSMAEAIKAADAARAPDIIAALRWYAVVIETRRTSEMKGADETTLTHYREQEAKARRDFLTLFGIEDTA